jgi:membrane protein
MTVRNTWPLVRSAFSSWSDHQAPRVGAALAFYTILSLAPLVIFLVRLVALLLGRQTAQTHLLDEVERTIGRQGAEAVKDMIAHAQKPATGTLASVFGVITLLFGASGVFGELRSALNVMWDIKPASTQGLWGTLKQRFFSFGMVLAVGFLLLVSLVISAVLASMGKWFSGFLPLPGPLLSVLDLVLSLGGVIVVFALVFRYVPDTRVAWTHSWSGAIVTGVMFTIGKYLIGFYVGTAGVGSAYGAAGSLVVILVWVYYSALIFLFGAELTHGLDAGPHGRA